jgi:hypothetical protein
MNRPAEKQWKWKMHYPLWEARTRQCMYIT